MNFIRVTDADNHTQLLLNLDSIIWIRKVPDNYGHDGCYQILCTGNSIFINSRDYQRILTALGIQ